MKKEFVIFLFIFVTLAFLMHFNQWLSHPIEHFEHLSTHEPYHPLFYTSIVYLFIAIVRWIIRSILKLFRKTEQF